MRYSFLHIPRTSGTTTMHVLNKIYPTAPYSFMEHYLDNLDKLPGFELYGGHVNYSIKQYLPEDTVFMTLFRDPVERTISYWRFTTRPDNMHYYKHLWHKQNMSLEQYINHPEISRVIWNPVTRYLGAEEDLDNWSMLPDYNRQFETGYGFDNILECFDRAKERMENFFWIGLQEEHVESLQRLFKKLGIEDDAHWSLIKEKKVKPKQFDYEPHIIDRIKELTVHDAQLYARAQDIFYGR